MGHNISSLSENWTGTTIEIYILTRIPGSDFVLLETIYQGNLNTKEKVVEILAACISLREFVLKIAKSLDARNVDKDSESGKDKGDQEKGGGHGYFEGGSKFFSP